MKNFKNLNVWEKAHLLVLTIYKVTNDFPKTETYGLTSQMRSACISIPANIAEGCGRDSDADFKRFLQIALGSANETQYYALLTRDLNLLDDKNYKNLDVQVEEIRRMLISLIKKIKDDVLQK